MLFKHNLYVFVLIKAKHNPLSGDFEDLLTKKVQNVDFWPFWPFLAIFGHFWPFLAIFGPF
jgi:hypothetical protein